MVSQIDAREVLCYLNELGYKNISQVQLKEFMKDLKKLIKYDQRQRQSTEKEEANAQNYSSSSAASPCKAKGKPPNHQRQQKKPTTKCITLEIKRPKYRGESEVPISICSVKPDKTNDKACSPIKIHEYANNNKVNKKCPVSTSNVETVYQKSCTLSAGSSNTDCLNLDLAGKQLSGVVKVTHHNKNFKGSASSLGQSNVFTNDGRCCYSQGTGRTRSRTVCSSKSDLKPKSSFIRPRITVKSARSDPVARYQYYQQQWSKCKLPGEDNHLQLRWAIRERLLGGSSYETLIGTTPSSCRSKSR